MSEGMIFVILGVVWVVITLLLVKTAYDKGREVGYQKAIDLIESRGFTVTDEDYKQ